MIKIKKLKFIKPMQNVSIRNFVMYINPVKKKSELNYKLQSMISLNKFMKVTYF